MRTGPTAGSAGAGLDRHPSTDRSSTYRPTKFRLLDLEHNTSTVSFNMAAR